jgi:hypothetical protein
MDFDQIAKRIFRRHAVLIAVCVLVGVAAALLVHLGDVRQYTAVTRLTLDTPDPKSSSESIAVADAARAIVTSPAQVRTALGKVGVARDHATLAREDVQLEQLGSSSVLQLSVRDRDPGVASSLANALAAQLIQVRLDLRRGAAIRLASRLEARIDDLRKQIVALDEVIVDRQTRAAAAGPNGSPSLNAQLASLRNERSNLVSQQSALETSRSQLTANDAMLPEASVIDPAVAPADADPSRIPHDLAIGVLLGLTLGICAAAVSETLRPSLIGGDAVAQALGTPLIGTLACEPGRGDSISGKPLVGLAARLQLVTNRARVRSVVLFSVKPTVAPTDLADRLQRVMRVPPGGNGSRSASPSRSPDVADPAVVGGTALHVLRLLYGAGDDQPAMTAGVAERANPRDAVTTDPQQLRVVNVADPLIDQDLDATGFVVVSPSPIGSAELKPVVDALALTGRPLLGVITYPRRTWRRRVTVPVSDAGTGEIGQ